MSFFIAINLSSMLYSLFMNDIFSLETLRFSSIRAYSTMAFGHMTCLWSKDRAICAMLSNGTLVVWVPPASSNRILYSSALFQSEKKAEFALKLRLYRIYMSRYCTPEVMLLKLRWISFVRSELLYMGMMSVLI